MDRERDGIVVRVHDGAPANGNGFLFASSNAGPPTAAEVADLRDTVQWVDPGGRKLAIQFNRTACAGAGAWWSAMEVWLGLVVSLLLAGVVLLATQTRRRAEALAEARTEQLQRRTGELESSRNLLDAVIQSVSVVVSVKDAAFRIALVNSEAERFLGLEVTDFPGKSDYELFEPAQADRIRAQDLAVLASGKPETIEESFISASGKPHWVTKRKVVVLLPDGGRGVMTTLYDITEQRASEIWHCASTKRAGRRCSRPRGRAFWSSTSTVSSSS